MTEPKWLIVRFRAIGDCVITTWAATAIRNAQPSSQIYWAAESVTAPVIDTEHLADGLVEFPRQKWKANRWSPATWVEQVKTYSKLRQFSFEFGIDFQGHSKTALCLRIARPKHRVSVTALDVFARTLNPILPPQTGHVVERNHRAVEHFLSAELPKRPIMPPALGKKDKLVTLSISAGHPSKVYPAEHWKTVAAQLLRAGYRVAVLGGPSDPPLQLDGVENLAGEITLRETLQWVSASQLHLAADTGTGHMAAAYGVPVVSIFGPTDPDTFRPYTDHGVVLKNTIEPASVPPESVIQAANCLLRPS